MMKTEAKRGEHDHLGEVQGRYGPLRLLEVQVQRCWAGQELTPGTWRLADGRTLMVRHPGTWNRGAGPDFRDAVVEMDGEVRMGDVELHLYREDWWRHGHDQDPVYGWVMLHVVLFGGGMPRPAGTCNGEVLPEWVMGPWLRDDLESVSGGEPGLWGEACPELAEWVRSEEPPAIEESLRAGCRRRWEAKESMASALLREEGWEGALHRLVLYYLGFPANRAAFYEMAERLPRERWRCSDLLDELREQWQGAVKWGVGRPANQPENRLRLYQRLNGEVRDWPERLRAVPEWLERSLGSGPAGMDGGTREVRRRGRLGALFHWLEEDVLGGVANPGLVRRLWVDAFLPLLATGERLSAPVAATLFFHSPPVSCPDAVAALAREWRLRAEDGQPQSNGWVQGLLWVESQLRVERLRRPTAPARGRGA